MHDGDTSFCSQEMVCRKYTPIPYFQLSSPLLKQKRNYFSIYFLKESMPARSCWHKALSQNAMLTVSLSDVMYIEADV